MYAELGVDQEGWGEGQKKAKKDPKRRIQNGLNQKGSWNIGEMLGKEVQMLGNEALVAFGRVQMLGNEALAPHSSLQVYMSPPPLPQHPCLRKGPPHTFSFT